MCAESLIGLALLAGCGGSDDRPDLEASLTTTQVTTAPVTTTTEADAALEASARSGIPATTRQRGVIVTQAGVAAAAVSRWERAVGSCVGPSGESDDAGASCTRAAWDQLFDQMFSVQYELLDLMGRLERGPCREALATALDALHGFLAGARADEGRLARRAAATAKPVRPRGHGRRRPTCRSSDARRGRDGVQVVRVRRRARLR